MSKQAKSNLSIIGCLVVGGLIGAGVMLLAAPQSGIETRQQLRSKSIELKDKALITYNDSRLKVGDAVNRVKSQASEFGRKVARRQGSVALPEPAEFTTA